MAIYLDEDMIGSHENKIGFPHLLLCMGVVVVLDDGSLCGAHFTTPDTEAGLLNMLYREVLTTGKGMRQLYCAANLSEHCDRHGGKSIRGKAEGLGFKGAGYVFDFGQLGPKNGAYVQVKSNGADVACDVEFRFEEDVKYKTDRKLYGDKFKDVTKVKAISAGPRTARLWEGHKTVKAKTYSAGVTVLDGGALRKASLTKVAIS